MNCDQLEQEFKDCCDQILNALNNLSTQLDNVENTLNKEIQEVYDEITIDISGTANGDYTCTFPTTEPPNSRPIPAYAESKSQQKTYTGKGLQGLHENLKLINTNLDQIHKEACKAIDPISTITIEDLYKYCDKSVNVDRSLYFDEKGEKKYITADEDYEEAIETAVVDLIKDSKFAYLLKNRTGDTLIAAPNNWITPILANFSLVQSKINNDEICNASLDTVSIVASPKYVTNVAGKVLIVHFVTFDNYPKRKKGSQIRQIQIPGAKEEYDWIKDFKDCVWQTGNQYAELQLAGYRASVSGWFASEGAADEFFDYVLDKLTTGVEVNRNKPKHKYGRTDIAAVNERPYRAFIESINPQGQAVCHIKYMPPPDEQP